MQIASDIPLSINYFNHDPPPPSLLFQFTCWGHNKCHGIKLLIRASVFWISLYSILSNWFPSLSFLNWFLINLAESYDPPLIFVQEKDSSPPSWLILNSLAPLYINNDQSLTAELKQTVKIPKSTIIQIKSVFHKNPIKKKRKINAILPFYWHQVLRCEKKYSPHPGKKQFRHVKNAHLTFPPCST